MHIEHVSIFKDNYIWVIINTKSNFAVAIDPGEADSLEAYLKDNNLILKTILITHHHFDHIGGIEKLEAIYKPDIYVPKHEDIKNFTHKVSDGDSYYLDSIDSLVSIIDIPGHTLGHVAYYFKQEKVLFCGDTLFVAGCGRLFEGSIEQLYNSLQKLSNLPGDTKVYCTHEYTLKNLQFAKLVEPSNVYIDNKILDVLKLRGKNIPTVPSTIKDEKQFNPFLHCNSKEIIDYLEKYFNINLTKEIDVFKYLRLLKDGF